MINADLPLGFGMALAQHPQAMVRFAHMTNEEQLFAYHKIFHCK